MPPSSKTYSRVQYKTQHKKTNGFLQLIPSTFPLRPHPGTFPTSVGEVPSRWVKAKCLYLASSASAVLVSAFPGSWLKHRIQFRTMRLWQPSTRRGSSCAPSLVGKRQTRSWWGTCCSLTALSSHCLLPCSRRLSRGRTYTVHIDWSLPGPRGGGGFCHLLQCMELSLAACPPSLIQTLIQRRCHPSSESHPSRRFRCSDLPAKLSRCSDWTVLHHELRLV